MPYPIHLSLTGESQGEIKGECTMAGREETTLINGLEHEVMIPRDRQSGLSTGKRVHNAMKLVKYIDSTTPLLYQALCSGEHFSEVVLKWYRIDKSGMEEHYFTTTLRDAILVSVREYIPDCLNPSNQPYGHMEELSFTYRAIEWTHDVGGTSSTDDWESPRH